MTRSCRKAKSSFARIQKDDETKADRANPRRIGTQLVRAASLCGLLIQCSQAAIAETTTINTPTTETQGPTSPALNGSDTLIITTSGSVVVNNNNAPGVSATNGNNFINNYGRITTNGSVSAAGSDVSGIHATGGSTVINNYGTIDTTGNGRSPGGNNASGINAEGGSNIINNFGTISAYGSTNARGIRVSGGNNTIRNYGIVTSRNGAAIAAQDGSNTIINAGTIIATGSGYSGILITTGNEVVTNVGRIVSYSGDSITFGAAGNTLNLGNGSFLAGNVNLGSGTQVNVTTGANYSKIISYTGTLSGVSTSGTSPVFINTSTKQIATYDTTIFSASSDALGDMAATISSLTSGHHNGTDSIHSVWARGLGTTSSYSGTTATLDSHYALTGVAIGYDALRSKDLTFGILGGYGQISLTANSETMQSANNTSDGEFLGLYGQKSWGNTSIDFGIYGGVQSFHQQRYINDNMAYLGNSSSNASYQGWWIAPELGITIKAGKASGWTILPTARVRYAQQWISSYTESGNSSANATVNGQNVSIGQSFVGIGTQRIIKTTLGKNTKMTLAGQVGYMHRGAIGNNTVNVTMIGQSLSLPAEAISRNAVAVTAGVSIDLSSTVALKIRGDVAAGSGINYIGSGWAGLSISF